MRKRVHQGQSGFTLIELMIVTLVILIVVTFGLPALREIFLRSSLETMTQQVEATLRRARFDAIKEGSSVVVQARPVDGVLRSYTDVPVVDNNGNRTDTVLAYEPVAGAPDGTTDRIISSVVLPNFVAFRAPASLEVVDGFTNVSGGPAGDAGISELVAVFRSDGSVQDVGALRVGDTRGNFFEFRIDIAASGKITLSKYDCEDDIWLERYFLDETTNKSEFISRWQWYLGYSGEC